MDSILRQTTEWFVESIGIYLLARNQSLSDIHKT